MAQGGGQATGRCCRVWLPDSVLPAGDRLRAALEGPGGANFTHLSRKHAGATFRVFGAANPNLPPWKRLQVVAQCHMNVDLKKVEADVLDLAETACDIVADGLGLSDEQVQQAFEDIRVERSDIKLAAPRAALVVPSPAARPAVGGALQAATAKARGGPGVAAPPAGPPLGANGSAPAASRASRATAAKSRPQMPETKPRRQAVTAGRSAALSGKPGAEAAHAGDMLPPAVPPAKRRKKQASSTPRVPPAAGADPPVTPSNQASVASSQVAEQPAGVPVTTSPANAAAAAEPEEEDSGDSASGEGDEEELGSSDEDEESEDGGEGDEPVMIADPVSSELSNGGASVAAFPPVKLQLFKLGEFCCNAFACFAGGNPSPELLAPRLSIDQRARWERCKEHLDFGGDTVTVWNLIPSGKRHAKGLQALMDYFKSKQRVGMVVTATYSVYMVPPDAAFLGPLGLASEGYDRPGCLLALQVPADTEQAEEAADTGRESTAGLPV